MSTTQKPTQNQSHIQYCCYCRHFAGTARASTPARSEELRLGIPAIPVPDKKPGTAPELNSSRLSILVEGQSPVRSTNPTPMTVGEGARSIKAPQGTLRGPARDEARHCNLLTPMATGKRNRQPPAGYHRHLIPDDGGQHGSQNKGTEGKHPRHHTH